MVDWGWPAAGAWLYGTAAPAPHAHARTHTCLPLAPKRSAARRQRAEADKAAARKLALADVLAAWLPLLDSFEAALGAQAAAEARSGPPPPGEARIHASYRALQLQLLELLKCAAGGAGARGRGLGGGVVGGA
jgi:hypothetical protein